MALHCFHLQAQKRDVRRQQVRVRQDLPAATSVALLDHITGVCTTPTQGVLRTEMRLQIKETLDRMDRSTGRCTCCRIAKAAASKRYVRGLERLRATIQEAASGAGHGPCTIDP